MTPLIFEDNPLLIPPILLLFHCTRKRERWAGIVEEIRHNGVAAVLPEHEGPEYTECHKLPCPRGWAGCLNEF